MKNYKIVGMNALFMFKMLGMMSKNMTQIYCYAL